MKKIWTGIFALTVTLGFAIGDLSMVYAQDESAEEFTLEEITVTAQKREENQQKVPIQMEVISGEQLAESGQDNVDEILKNVSNAIINMSPDGMRVTVRGLADEDSVWHDLHTSTPTVAVNIDGAYKDSSNAGQNLFDIERVEVLAGPQSTLYGSNSPGGIVNVVTASPKTDRYSANGSVEYGSYSLRNYQAVFNAPVYSDKIAMRLAAQMNEQGSWIDNGDTSSKTKTARLKTLFRPSEKFSSTVTLNWSKASSGGQRMRTGMVGMFDYQDGYWYMVNMDGSVTKGEKVTNPWTIQEAESDDGATAMSFRGVGGNLVATQGPPPGGGGGGPAAAGNDATTKGISGDISWDTGIGALSIVPSYSKTHSEDFDDDFELQSGEITTQYSENESIQKGAEVRMASPQDAPFTWIVGGTYNKSERHDNLDDYLFDSNDAIRDMSQTNKALYGNITYPFTDKLRGTAGYRRSWDKIQNIEIPAKVGTGYSGQDYSNPDYKVGVEYDLAENSMLYASYATSYRINAMAVKQATNEGDRTVPPEEMKAYTVGAKNRFLGNKLQLNTSVFYYDYKNKKFQATEDGRFMGGATVDESAWPHYEDGVLIPGTDFNNDGDYTDTNAEGGDLYNKDISDPWTQQFGSFRSYGLDVSTNWMITGKDRLDLSVSCLNAKWTDAKIQFYWSWIWESEGKDLSGRKNTFSPALSATAAYEHNFTLGSLGMLVPHVDVKYQSSYELSFDEEIYPFNHQEANYILNGNITYTHSSGKWSLNTYVKNATNYAVKTFWQNVSGNYSLGLNDPRTFGAVLSVRF